MNNWLTWLAVTIVVLYGCYALLNAPAQKIPTIVGLLGLAAACTALGTWLTKNRTP